MCHLLCASELLHMQLGIQRLDMYGNGGNMCMGRDGLGLGDSNRAVKIDEDEVYAEFVTALDR